MIASCAVENKAMKTSVIAFLHGCFPNGDRLKKGLLDIGRSPGPASLTCLLVRLVVHGCAVLTDRSIIFYQPGGLLRMKSTSARCTQRV